MRCPRIRTWVSTVTSTTFAGTRLMTTTPLPRKFGTLCAPSVHSHFHPLPGTMFRKASSAAGVSDPWFVVRCLLRALAALEIVRVLAERQFHFRPQRGTSLQ